MHADLNEKTKTLNLCCGGEIAIFSAAAEKQLCPTLHL
jgi:iron-sulfur cluster repair protein YtfE (RIC family)